jgi:hypothetical protein
MISHYGSVRFEGGSYVRAYGSTNWTVQPIAGFGAPIGPPLAQVRIEFSEHLEGPSTIVVSAQRTGGAPMLCANVGNSDEKGFVVHLFEPVSTRTLQNGGFSFVVLT